MTIKNNEPLRITQIRILKLFGNLKHEIPLNDEGITFIHGPNGCGKTTLLKLIQSFLEGDFRTLKSGEFQNLEFKYSDGYRVIVKITKQARSKALDYAIDERGVPKEDRELSISLMDSKNKKIEEFKYLPYLLDPTKQDLPIPIGLLEHKFPLRRVGPREWLDLRNNVLLNYSDVLEMYGDKLNLPHAKRPEWLIKRLGITKVGIVKTQRLINLSQAKRSYRSEEEEVSRDVVEIYSNKIKEIIAKKLAESAVQSQARDRSFPTRLLAKEFPSEVPQSELVDLYRRTEERAQNLMAAGLLDQADSIPLPNTEFTKFERDVVGLYLADFNEKLDAFKELQQKIEALVEIVGTKLRRKKFTIDRHKGFVFETSEGRNRNLSVTDLSSGEQHQIVLFYELLFCSEGINFFLIDEPEISLHVEWQRRFLDDLKKVQKITGSYFLIATHSPQIINNRRDISVALDGGVSE